MPTGKLWMDPKRIREAEQRAGTTKEEGEKREEAGKHRETS